jgi:N-acylneuraminate cytidylyltransferase
MRLAVIPARGGSKRIPRKNVKTFAGKPVIAYSIEAAKCCGLFERIIVSTDDPEIGETAQSFGAEFPFVRPAELSDDYASSMAVIKHSVQWVEAHWGKVDHVCCIYATAPFVQVKYLREGYEKLVLAGKSFAFSVTSFPFPIQRAIRLNGEGCVEMFHPEYYEARSQDMEEAYHDAGQFYWGTATAFMAEVPIFSSGSVPVILPRYLVQDIDTPEDWRRAEIMYRVLREEGEIAA